MKKFTGAVLTAFIFAGLYLGYLVYDYYSEQTSFSNNFLNAIEVNEQELTLKDITSFNWEEVTIIVSRDGYNKFSVNKFLQENGFERAFLNGCAMLERIIDIKKEAIFVFANKRSIKNIICLSNAEIRSGDKAYIFNETILPTDDPNVPILISPQEILDESTRDKSGLEHTEKLTFTKYKESK